MRRILTSVVAALVIIGGLVGVVAVENAAAGVYTFSASLFHSNEVPPNASGYTGVASITVDTSTFEVCVNATTNVPDSDAIVAQHIHEGAEGVNGPIVVPFTSLDSCAISTSTIVDGIVANPSGFYFNVHTTMFPGGALRGQLALQPTPSSLHFMASLSATNEVPPNASGLTGTAFITIDTTNFVVCVSATTTATDADPIILQHIHRGPAGVNGPIVVPFASLQDCVVSDAATVNEIVSDPLGFYFNVHTEAFPGGALRGQLVPITAPQPPVEEIVVVTPAFTG